MIMSKKKVLLWVLLCCICISCTIGYLRLQASAAVAEIVDCELPPEFEFGDNFVMPDGKVSYKGQEKTPDSKYILFPSGKAQGGEAIALSETGKYELVFSASFDGATITARKSFLVKKPILQVDNESSSAQIVDGKIGNVAHNEGQHQIADTGQSRAEQVENDNVEILLLIWPESGNEAFLGGLIAGTVGDRLNRSLLLKGKLCHVILL